MFFVVAVAVAVVAAAVDGQECIIHSINDMKQVYISFLPMKMLMVMFFYSDLHQITITIFFVCFVRKNTFCIY